MRNKKSYPREWRKLARHCKEAANWQCVKCGVEQGHKRKSKWTGRSWPVYLQAAHVNHDQANASPDLVCVCPYCHWHFYRRRDQIPAWLFEKVKHRIVLEREGYR